ncbi:carnosine N-methyltransferase 2-like [Acanthaster planci]|uniref:Carnosine N-methyltransferase 2-like n=1 Tax=Acanthaster planci TaxID=133434 RepID=A0A8B7XHB1_ACAPL|nr:carnosine N-methyltransferase 2-like [Acanthaster planci]
MASTRLRSLSHHPDDYAKSFSAYMAVSDKFDSYATWGDNVFGKAVTSKITVMLGEQEELRILGIGSGSGELDVKMLTKLLLRFPLINNRVVEPAGFMIAKYKALVESKAHELQGVRCDWRQQTMQQYAKEAGDSTKFHFIHACQSCTTWKIWKAR